VGRSTPGYYLDKFTKPYDFSNLGVPGVGTGTGADRGVSRLPNWNTSPITPYNSNLKPLAGLQKTNNPYKLGVTSTENTPFNPTLSPLGHILSGVGQLSDYFAMKRARPTPMSLGRVGSERISLAKQRLANERNAATSRSINAASTRGLGLNAGSTYANTIAANTGVNRLLGQQNAELLQNEENANAQLRQQANMTNAEIAAQEGIMNAQRMDAYRARMASMNPLGNLARTAASYFANNAAQKQQYDILQMMAPDAELYQRPGSTKLRRLLGFDTAGFRARNK
jgi:hypothetical protein